MMKFDSGTWDYCFGKSNDVAYYIHEFEDNIKQYIISTDVKTPLKTQDSRFNPYRVDCDGEKVRVLCLDPGTGQLLVENRTTTNLETLNIINNFTS